jgi:hypothetical protein
MFEVAAFTAKAVYERRSPAIPLMKSTGKTLRNRQEKERWLM